MTRRPTRAKARFLICLMPLGMAACSTATRYPSLSVREVERPGGSAVPAPGEAAAAAPALPPASADLVTRLAGLEDVAHTADRQFQSHRAAAERAAAGAGGPATDAGSTASIALARLESSRSSGMAALAELDILYADARETAPLGDSPAATAIGIARARVAALIDAQDAVIARLEGRLKN